jgi:hypothetical protein
MGAATVISAQEAQQIAESLDEEAVAAGLTVSNLRPQLCGHRGNWSCYVVDLRAADGQTWMEASHESESSIRRAIVLFRDGRADQHALAWTRRNLTDSSYSAACLCGETVRGGRYEDALAGIWEHRDEELAELAEAASGE